MDPNAALKEAREMREAMRAWLAVDCVRAALEAAEMMADRFEALDEWLSNGGFLPNEWEH